MTFKTQMQTDLDIFYNTDEFAEEVNIESADGDDVYHDIHALITFGEGEEYRGADALGNEGTMRIRVSDIETIATGYSVYRGTETWRILDAKKSEDDLEWIAVISRINR
jgi:hypothetical protein